MTSPNPVTFPLGPPTISGNIISVDEALNSPTYISQRLADLTLQRFIVNRIFATGGIPVQGGAIIYDQITSNQLYTTNDVEQVAPGSEFPIVGGVRTQPLVAQVSKYGGKFQITDEARKRNDSRRLDQLTTQLANTIVRKINTLAMAALDAEISSMGAATTFNSAVNTSSNTRYWGSLVTRGTQADSDQLFPFADFLNAQALADKQELGVTLDLVLLNPLDQATLHTLYGQGLSAMLADSGFSTYASNRVTKGSAYVVATGQVGFLEYEQGLNTETWREPEDESSWVQSSVRPIMGITNPYSVYKVTNISASS
jgi:hypothetical protein